jgi:hypothetical protein
MRRSPALVVFLAMFLALGISAASADWVNGQGQTPKSASVGFNAKDDLTGELNYNADPNGEDAGFSAHCKDYRSFRLTYDGQGFPKVTVTAICTDQDDVTVYLMASFKDRGEPGTQDEVCINWSYTLPMWGNQFIQDKGIILAGNIQIHEDPLNPGKMLAEMMVEVEEP